jgi:thioredoxin 1
MDRFQEGKAEQQKDKAQTAKLTGDKEELKSAAQKKEDFSQVAYDEAKAASANRDTPVVVLDYWATSCGPCITVERELRQVARDRGSKSGVKFFRSFDVDKDKGDADAIDHGVRNMPTLVFFKDGKEVRKLTNFPAEKTGELVKEILSSLSSSK